MRKRIFTILLALQLVVCNEQIIYATQIPQTEAVEAEESEEDFITVSESNLASEPEPVEPEEIPPLTYMGEEEISIHSLSDLNIPVYNKANLESKYISPYVTSVKNQNPYGTCWAFACVAASEANLVKKGLYSKDNIDLSEWHLAYFMTNQVLDPLGLTDGDSFCWLYSANNKDYLDHGGNQQHATYRLANWVGLADEKTAPYETIRSEENRNVKLDNSLAYQDIVHMENSYWVSMWDRDDVKDLIKEYGACAASYYHVNSCYNWKTSDGSVSFYNSGAENTTNHAITIVGWDDKYSKDNFKDGSKLSKDGAWYCKNSWGEMPNYTKDGYFWISYEELSLTGTQDDPNMAYFYDCAKSDNYDYNYHYDGGIGGSYYSFNGGISEANIYTAHKDESLKAIGFYTLDSAYLCTVNIYKGCNEGKPLSGECVATVNANQLYAGFHTVKLNSPISLNENEKFSVVIRLQAEDETKKQGLVLAVPETQQVL